MSQSSGRLRSYLHFIFAVLFFFLARAVANRLSLGWVSEPWQEVVASGLLVVLLLAGYGWLGLWINRESKLLDRQGWPLRAGLGSEVGLGVAFGWALALVCVLPTIIGGGIAVVLDLHLSAWGWLLVDALYFALVAAVEEIGFRGYGFQCFAQAVGPVGASIGFSAIYAILQAQIPGAPRVSIWVAILLNLVLSTVYWRTRALWVSWGINFGWKASRALIFGLAVSGVNHHAHVVQGNPMGSFWVTGGGFGLEGSWITWLILLVAWPVVFRLTRELDYRYNQPEIVAAGIPVYANQACKPSAEVLVQILPAQPLEPVPSEGHDAPAESGKSQ